MTESAANLPADERSPLQVAALEVQDDRIKHADTQATGIMGFAASAVGILGAGSGFQFPAGVEAAIVIPLFMAFVFAVLARLADIWGPIANRGDTPTERSRVAAAKGVLIAYALLALLVAVFAGGVGALID